MDRVYDMGVALIDGDIIVYRSAFATQKTIYTHRSSKEFFEGITKAKMWFAVEHGWKKDETKGLKKFLEDKWDINDWVVEDRVEPFNACAFLIDSIIQKIMIATGADYYKVYLSPSKNFRHDISTVREYKANRPPPPVHKNEAREYMMNYYSAEVGDNIEADDLLGLNQTTDTVICSIDKDLLQIPGRHYNFVDDVHSIVDIYEADSWLFTQILAGDVSTDNIQGLPGIGDAKATTIVDSFAGDHTGLVEEIKYLYEESYPARGKNVLEEMTRLVYILRKGDVLGENEQWRELLSI